MPAGSRPLAPWSEAADLAEGFDAVWRQLHLVLATEAALNLGDMVDSHPDRTSAALRQIVGEGRAVQEQSYAEARAAQATLRDALGRMLEGYDALLMVPAPGEAPLGLADTGDATFCAPWSFTGVPAITLPAGWSRRGLPLGLQFVGAWQQDRHVLQVAKWAEDVLQWRRRPLDEPASG